MQERIGYLLLLSFACNGLTLAAEIPTRAPVLRQPAVVLPAPVLPAPALPAPVAPAPVMIPAPVLIPLPTIVPGPAVSPTPAPAPAGSGSAAFAAATDALVLRENLLLDDAVVSRDLRLSRAGAVRIVSSLSEGAGAVLSLTPRASTGGLGIVRALDATAGSARDVALLEVTAAQVASGGNFELRVSRRDGAAVRPRVSVEIYAVPN